MMDERYLNFDIEVHDVSPRWVKWAGMAGLACVTMWAWFISLNDVFGWW